MDTDQQQTSRREPARQGHSQDAERHEQAAKHHWMAQECEERGDGIGAAEHARKARGHEVHAAMSWIDPESLRQTEGRLTSLLYDVHGRIDGLLLDDGRQVHIPPHVSAELLHAVKVGERIVVRGVKQRDVDILVAASVAAAGPALLKT